MSRPGITEADIAGSDGWINLVALANERGRTWVESFHALGAEDLIESIHDALRLLLQRRFDEGWDLLQSLAPENTALASADQPTLLDAYRPWYHNATAYYFYSRNDFDRAEAEIRAVTEASIRACEAEDFLVILAIRCCDVELQRARMHRNHYHWRHVADHLATVQEMIESRRPLCTLEGGRAITFADLRAWSASLDFATEDNREAIDKVLDPNRWKIRFRGLVAELYALPWMIIPYG
ncbi:MAG: hypothetical protein AAGD38_17995 [Acidobacteriota bacterium]